MKYLVTILLAAAVTAGELQNVAIANFNATFDILGPQIFFEQRPTDFLRRARQSSKRFDLRAKLDEDFIAIPLPRQMAYFRPDTYRRSEQLSCSIAKVSMNCNLEEYSTCARRNWTAAVSFKVAKAAVNPKPIYKIFVWPLFNNLYDGDVEAVQDQAWLAITADEPALQNPRQEVTVTLIASCCLRQLRVLAENGDRDQDDCQFDYCNMAQCHSSAVCTPLGNCYCPENRHGKHCEITTSDQKSFKVFPTPSPPLQPPRPVEVEYEPLLIKTTASPPWPVALEWYRNGKCAPGFLCCFDAKYSFQQSADTRVYYDPIGQYECCDDGTVVDKGRCRNSAVISDDLDLFPQLPKPIDVPPYFIQNNGDGELRQLYPPSGRLEHRVDNLEADFELKSVEAPIIGDSTYDRMVEDRPNVASYTPEIMAYSVNLRELPSAINDNAAAFRRHQEIGLSATRSPPSYLLQPEFSNIVSSNKMMMSGPAQNSRRLNWHRIEDLRTMPTRPKPTAPSADDESEMVTCEGHHYGIQQKDMELYACCGKLLYFWLTEKCLRPNLVELRNTGQVVSQVDENIGIDRSNYNIISATTKAPITTTSTRATTTTTRKAKPPRKTRPTTSTTTASTDESYELDSEEEEKEEEDSFESLPIDEGDEPVAVSSDSFQQAFRQIPKKNRLGSHHSSDNVEDQQQIAMDSNRHRRRPPPISLLSGKTLVIEDKSEQPTFEEDEVQIISLRPRRIQPGSKISGSQEKVVSSNKQRHKVVDRRQQKVVVVAVICNGVNFWVPISQRDAVACCGSELFNPKTEKCNRSTESTGRQDDTIVLSPSPSSSFLEKT